MHFITREPTTVVPAHVSLGLGAALLVLEVGHQLGVLGVWVHAEPVPALVVELLLSGDITMLIRPHDEMDGDRLAVEGHTGIALAAPLVPRCRASPYPASGDGINDDPRHDLFSDAVAPAHAGSFGGKSCSILIGGQPPACGVFM